ncbi:MAG: RluA family pseudouridine synthase [Gammaproteobacteria bacterium]|nr:RluA family pseudouridine synthase [Gammaproteobacteria bacterium]
MVRENRLGNLSAKKLIAFANDAGQRLDNFLLKTLKGVPKTYIYRIIRTGQVRVNSKRIKAGYKLQEYDEIRIPPMRRAEKTSEDIPGEKLQTLLSNSVIYEDKSLLVINKPAGIAVHAGSGIKFGVIEIMRAIKLEFSNLELVHRLDRDTSGCLLLAKKRSVLVDLQQQFQNDNIKKTYLALIKGPWQGKGRVVDQPLHKYRSQDGEGLVKIAPSGKKSISEFIPEHTAELASLMKVILHTGRTHQIRVHAAFLGRPIARDQKYGDREFNKKMAFLGLKRMFLHAYELQFLHPVTKKTIAIKAELPLDLQMFLRKLNQRIHDKNHDKIDS